MTVKRMRQDHMVNIMLPVALLLMFAVSALAVLLFATRAYQSIVRNSAQNDASRIALSYVSEKLHRLDASGKISLDTLEGQEVLALEQEHGEDRYRTYIYVYDGELKELFVKEGTSVSLSSGRTVLELERFDMESLGDGLLRFTCADTAGQTATALVALRSETEAAS